MTSLLQVVRHNLLLCGIKDAVGEVKVDELLAIRGFERVIFAWEMTVHYTFLSSPMHM